MIVMANLVMFFTVFFPLADSPSTQELEQQLMAADRAFAKAATEHGLDGWMEYMADDAARIEKLGGKFIKGKEAIRKSDAALFADPQRRLVWEPVDAHIHADRQSGLTSGRYRLVKKGEDGKESVIAQGSYFTGWRKQADGKWKVTFDGGGPDAPIAK